MRKWKHWQFSLKYILYLRWKHECQKFRGLTSRIEMMFIQNLKTTHSWNTEFQRQYARYRSVHLYLLWHWDTERFPTETSFSGEAKFSQHQRISLRTGAGSTVSCYSKPAYIIFFAPNKSYQCMRQIEWAQSRLRMPWKWARSFYIIFLHSQSWF